MKYETTKQYFRVDRREIGFIKFIIEAYEGLAVAGTEDAENGYMKFSVAPGCENEFAALISELKKEIMISGPLEDITEETGVTEQ
ncbi:MAG: DUF4911 domain-containing protein [Desulfobacterales bacterium]